MSTVTLDTADFLVQPTGATNGTTSDPEEAQEKQDLRDFVEQRRKAAEQLRSKHRAAKNTTAASTVSTAVAFAANSTAA